MDFETLKALDTTYLMQNDRRMPIALDHGKGAIVYDLENRPYIDFCTGIGAVGHGNDSWVEAIIDQALKLTQTTNLIYTEPVARLAERLCIRSGLAAACFTNSGIEANDTMIELARKYSFDRYGAGRNTILTLKNGTHMSDIVEKADRDVCAVMLELVQEGIAPLSCDFVHSLAVLCAERDWLLLVDEVQTGMGRSGTLFAFQQYGILPDAVSFANGLAGGLPMGGILVNGRCRNSGHRRANTSGGNPICAAAALTVLDFLDEQVLAEIKDKGNYMRAGVDVMQLSGLGATSGLGLMVGIEVCGVRSHFELMT
ncbi:MAG: aminotransferase class III-fold pyridoxal phosphate-dependent enzyme, partial [Evtepia sp.]